MLIICHYANVELHVHKSLMVTIFNLYFTNFIRLDLILVQKEVAEILQTIFIIY